MGTFDRFGASQASSLTADSTSTNRLRPLLQPSLDAADRSVAISPAAVDTAPHFGTPVNRIALGENSRKGALPGNALAGLSARPPLTPLWLNATRQVAGQPDLMAADSPAARPVARWSPTTQMTAPTPAWLPGGLQAVGRTAAPTNTVAAHPAGIARGHGLSGLPPRAAGSATGSQFLAATTGMSRSAREEAIFQEFAKGNVPDFIRHFEPVTTSVTAADGTRHTAKFYVLPDYLAIGSNKDFVRMPMSPLTAQRVADLTGCSLPTRKMVDKVYAEATVHLKPQPQPASPQMMSNAYYQHHQEMVESQRAGQPLGALTAGHKKDVVLSNQLVTHPGKVAIYGWHQPSGKAIQPLSTVHENTYADYSHGIRLVAPTMEVDGRVMKTADVMRSPTLSGLISDEGPLKLTRVPGS